MNLEKLLKINPYYNKQKEKNFIFIKYIKLLTMHHIKNCKDYKNIIANLKFKTTKTKLIEKFPMLPISLFKSNNLMSIKKDKIVKTLVSSGTSGNNLSKIYLDKRNAINQTKVLDIIFSRFISKERLPMMIVDKNPSLVSRHTYNAKSAAIYGFSIFGKNHFFLLNSEGEIDYTGLNKFLLKYGKNKFFIFGFTSMVYEQLIKKITKKIKKLRMDNGILLHGGGWKKLEKFKIDNKEFKEKLLKKLNIKKVHNYYGLVEQTGSIYIESPECGYFHTSIFSDIFIRDKNFNILKNKKKGLIQLISLLPTSYPGHNILTEDIGEIIGVDDCKCGLKGKYFIIHGRAKQAEIRGCSDVN
jgi:phenylacetate-coenzyme A ligase PaaK-like adenylate-forming protein